MQQLDTYSFPKELYGKSKLFVQLWWVVQTVFCNPSPQFMYGWRRFWWRLFGAKVGKKVIIRPSVKCTYPWKVKIGDYSWIGDQVVLYSVDSITIEKNTVVSQKSYLCTASHDYKLSNFPTITSPIYIKEGCWLASDVYVAPGVTIGQETLVGARSSVFSSLPDKKICVGSPAKPIKDRSYS
ncbi:colanic acid biosynthesis acetyltransferase WcaF [Croceivirga lutea]|uniref:WcaF family extracellular polysaccharide biosynthesis acetyltransferase n=1 Tax=Croceivirga lutea TaxID=1775167 RepID=UPI00163B39F7|nr:WcaF family extracellular polysaccharide biosynthesis acetyltransferase [Croceivirga lutea]GGG42453.1 colanic acid biosynthesis acetyltransferase WcaF [Croceivirga lutea]